MEINSDKSEPSHFFFESSEDAIDHAKHRDVSGRHMHG
jgi:hypothetical protein